MFYTTSVMLIQISTVGFKLIWFILVQDSIGVRNVSDRHFKATIHYRKTKIIDLLVIALFFLSFLFTYGAYAS